MSRRALAAPLGILALALCGCGSSTLTAQQLRRQASLVCSAAVERSDRIALPSSNEGGADFLDRGITVFRPELTSLRKLAPPRSLAEPYRAALADSKQQLDALIASDENLASGGDPVVAIRQLDVELEAIDARDRQAWRAVGAPVCDNLPNV
ncbi:MAG TPA: hypothetical protein VG186_15845 [Solirubrobacteraceae bacterium]|jgi:hypothetical protein|nr:hypothetical protein [Solirubrobacteraceae bacterium]